MHDAPALSVDGKRALPGGHAVARAIRCGETVNPSSPTLEGARGRGVDDPEVKRRGPLNEDLAGKVVAITGAASGIGLACAKACLIAGARVVLVDQAEDRLKQLCSELGNAAIPLRINLTDPESVAGMMPQILSQAGRLDVFHANAGCYVGGDVIGGDPDAW